MPKSERDPRRRSAATGTLTAERTREGGVQAAGSIRRPVELIRTAGPVFVVRVLAAGLGFLFTFILARVYGANGSGLFFLAAAVVSVPTVVARLGLDSAMVRFVGASSARGDWESVAGLYRRALRITLGLAFALTVAVIAGARTVASVVFSEPELTEPLRVAALAIAPLASTSLYAALLRAVGKPAQAAAVRLVVVPLVATPGLLALAGLGVIGAVAAQVIASVTAVVSGAVLWRRAVPRLHAVRGQFDTRTLLQTSIPLFWVSAMDMVSTWTDTTVLGLWADSADVGIYSIAARLALTLSFVLFAVNTVVAPRFAALYDRGAYRELGALLRRSTALASFFTVPLAVVIVIRAEWILGQFGPAFPAGAGVLVVLTIGQVVNVLTGTVGTVLAMTGHERLLQYNLWGSTTLNLVLNLLLVPAYGAMGAAVATAGTMIVRNIVSAALVHRHLSVVPLPRLW